MINNSSVEEIFKMIETTLNENPGPIQGSEVVYQYDLSGEDGGTYQLHLANGKAVVEKGAPADPACTLQMKVEHFKQFLLGNLNGTSAFMTGKLKIKGNIGEALKLESLLRQYDLKNS